MLNWLQVVARALSADEPARGDVRTFSLEFHVDLDRPPLSVGADYVVGGRVLRLAEMVVYGHGGGARLTFCCLGAAPTAPVTLEDIVNVEAGA